VWSRLRYRGYSYGLVGRSRGQQYPSRSQEFGLGLSLCRSGQAPFAGIYIMLYSRSSSDLSITVLFSVSENPKVPVPLGGIGTPTSAVSKTLVGRFGVWSRWVKCNLNRRHSILRVKSMPSVKSIGQPIDCSFFGGRSYYSGQSYTRLQYHKQSSCYDNDTSEARCSPIVTAIPKYHGSSELPAGIRFSKIASSTCMKQPITI